MKNLIYPEEWKQGRSIHIPGPGARQQKRALVEKRIRMHFISKSV
jgi:hypothetical protein